jgi:hypothetical protein
MRNIALAVTVGALLGMASRTGHAEEVVELCSTGSIACANTCTVDPKSCKKVPDADGVTCIMKCKNKSAQY